MPFCVRIFAAIPPEWPEPTGVIDVNKFLIALSLVAAVASLLRGGRPATVPNTQGAPT